MKNKLISTLAGILLGMSCIYPNTFLSPLTVFALCVLFFVSIDYLKSKELFLVGLAFHLTSMWWLWPTMEKFGDMPSAAAFALMILHSCLSSFQFSLTFYLANKFSKKLPMPEMFILFWILAELYFPRMFPWTLGNFFIIVTPLSSLAEIFGVSGVSLIVLIFALCLSRIISFNAERKSVLVRFAAYALSICGLLYVGYLLSLRSEKEQANISPINALVVQGNLSIEEKGKQEFLKINLDKYKELSSNAYPEKIDFIIWPESVVSAWLNLETQSYNSLDGNVFSNLSTPLLYGGLAYTRTQTDAEMFNAALLWQNGRVSEQYYAKRVLMPFGEFVPFAGTFPFIRNFTPIPKDFSVGTKLHPLEISLPGSKSVKTGVSICYEDLSSGLAREIVKNGAEVLINLTNDAWYGESPAPFQHDLLARFRAIETRRFLIRATNTGFTTLTDPSGKIIDKLELFKSEAKVFPFYPLSRITVYVQHGNIPLILLFTLFLLSSLSLNAKQNSSANHLKKIQ